MCWEQGKTEQTALQKRAQESCLCPSAAGLQPKEPFLCCSCFLSSSSSACALILSTQNVACFPRGLINAKMGTPVTEQGHLPWAFLQKMTFFHLCSLESEITFKCGKPWFNLSHWPNHKTIFVFPTTYYSCSSETTLSCALVWVKVSQDTEKKNEESDGFSSSGWYKGCSRAEPQSWSSSWLPPLASQGKPPVSQSVKKDPKAITNLLEARKTAFPLCFAIWFLNDWKPTFCWKSQQREAWK